MRSHSSLSGVLYAEDFDAPDLPAAVAPEPIRADAPVRVEPIVLEPTFSLVDLQRAADHARQEERIAAAREAEQTAAALRTEALVRIADVLSQARDDAARIASEAAEAVAHTVLAAIAALLPAFAAERGRSEAAALLRLLLPAMSHEPRLSVRAHPTLIDDLRQDMAALLQAIPTLVDWTASETMAPGDLAVRWLDGTMVRDLASLCAQIGALIMPPTPAPRETADAH